MSAVQTNHYRTNVNLVPAIPARVSRSIFSLKSNLLPIILSLLVFTGYSANAAPRSCFEILSRQKAEISAKTIEDYFRQLSKDQWQFYADSVNPTTSFLPPDNVRVEQGKNLTVDYRTSPTNIGLYMLSTMTAKKLGFITQGQAVARLKQTVETIKNLPKYKSTVKGQDGKTHAVEHLYNWYSINNKPAEIGGGFISTVDNGNLAAFLISTITAVGKSDAKLTRDLKQIVEKMRFDVLYDSQKNLLYHGAQVKDGKLFANAGHYDMLLSEARSAYAVAIMLGQIPETSWKNLKRKLGKNELDNINTNPRLRLQSYTGTMFEYLTTRLFMKHEGTPLGQADEQAVRLQRKDVVAGLWGKSEANSNTSRGYAAWGVGGLSQSREFTTTGDQVIAPYASEMAAGLAPKAVVANLQEMDKLGLRERYGHFESVTVKGTGTDIQYQVTPQFFAHHVGMGFLGIANHLDNNFVAELFHQSAYNKNGAVEKLLSLPLNEYRQPENKKAAKKEISNAYAYEPSVSYDKSKLIGNGNFVSKVGGLGSSTILGHNYVFTHNQLFYIRDNNSGKLLSLNLDAPDATRIKNGVESLDYNIDHPAGGKIGVTLENSVSAVSKIKVTKVIIQNRSNRPLNLQVTGYVDFIMEDVNSYNNHPVHRNLFTLTELDSTGRMITARRRTMQGAEQARQPYGFFALGPNVTGAADWADGSRLNILGRLNGLAAPQAVVAGKSVGKYGPTLDPAAALAKSVSISQGQSAEVSFVLGFADDKNVIPNMIASFAAQKKSEQGAPQYPPDATVAKMDALNIATKRGLRMKNRPMPKRAANISPDKIGHWEMNGRKYVIDDPFAPSKPWSMVVSNGKYGFVATAAGWAYSFGSNSQQIRVTPYMPDITTELPMRGVIVKDKKSGETWSITPNPAPSTNGQYKVEVSPGYIKYMFNRNDGLSMTMTMFVAQKDPVEFWQISVENKSNADVELELSSFIKWALGANYPSSAALTKVNFDSARRAILATSTDAAAPESVGFHRIVGGDTQVRENNLYAAEGDPFSGLSTDLKVAKGGRKEISFMLGLGENSSATNQYMQRYGETANRVEKERRTQLSEIGSVLNGLQVQTPDKSIDIMLNTWLPYQAYYAHYLARSGFYQSGGAYGFRDQLQTVMNLINSGHAQFRAAARAHIIESTRHQFEKGDVQHWWHPHNNLGQRSTISDNLLWLPLAISHYVEVTGDVLILKELTPFSVASRDLREGELDFVEKMGFSENKVDVYEHAKRAISLVLKERMGEHGLPLMGKGDWNDGLDRVGHLGKGESVWLGFFLYDVLNKFAKIAKIQGDTKTQSWYLSEAAKLKQNLDTHGWNGKHYIRAFADNGEKIDFNDAIVQAWAVMSKGTTGDKASKAVDAADRDLFDRKNKMILLFDRPLGEETWGGSLAAYPRGLRENQAQYTHGSSWLPRAAAELGKAEVAVDMYKAMLPITHASDPNYGGEPYSVAADIYGGDKAGEAGWTWYSGAPGWIYRTGIETILGLKFRDGTRLVIDPTIPAAWPGFGATYKNGKAHYQIQVLNPQRVNRGVKSMTVDGVSVDVETGITLVDDGKIHQVVVTMGSR